MAERRPATVFMAGKRTTSSKLPLLKIRRGKAAFKPEAPRAILVLVSLFFTDSSVWLPPYLSLSPRAFGVVCVLAMCLFAFSVRHLMLKPRPDAGGRYLKAMSSTCASIKRETMSSPILYLSPSQGMMDHLQRVDPTRSTTFRRAELKQLQSQVNPHFCTTGFNIYRMAKRATTMTLPSSPSC